VKAKLRHLAIHSSDPDAAARFYVDAFGFEEVGRAESAGGRAVYLSDGVMNVAIFELHQDGLPNAGPLGLNHFGVIVEDRDAAMAHLDALGARCILPPPADAVAGNYEIKYETPDGVQFDVSSHAWPVSRSAEK
jgi:catechol 2,3-dioxygenase-like lactoylglutathione lyase family enzyme